MSKHQIYTMSFASVYPLCISKAAKKGRTKSEVDEIIRWLTGYTQDEMKEQLKKQTDFETFFKDAPLLNPSRTLIKGVICVVMDINEADSFFKEINISAMAIKTIGHSDDSISIIFNDGCAFIGHLHNQDLIMEDDCESSESWHALREHGAKKIYPAHGIDYLLD